MFKFSTVARIAGRAVIIMQWIDEAHVIVRFAASEICFATTDKHLEQF